MALYAIGDIQGCYDDLLRLLDVIQFNPSNDQLWFAGDLVNRGPKSLETLRFIKNLGSTSAMSVLGNHDIHLLAIASTQKKQKTRDTLSPILTAPDRDELIDWLRKCPLFHYNNNYGLLHAGLPPQWTISRAKKMSKAIEKVLQSDDYPEFLTHIYGNHPNVWSNNLKGIERLRFSLNCFTRLRYCDAQGRLDFNEKGSIGSQASHLSPWFQIKSRQSKSHHLKLIFGHWSTLGFYEDDSCCGIDTGCLWSGQLTALKLGKTTKRISIT